MKKLKSVDINIPKVYMKKFHKRKLFCLNLWEIAFMESILSNNRFSEFELHYMDPLTGQDVTVDMLRTYVTKKQESSFIIILKKIINYKG